jgi:hypothetical protein
MSLEYSGAANTLELKLLFSFVFYIDYNIKLPLNSPDNNKKNQCESIKNPIESCFKNIKSKDNMVIHCVLKVRIPKKPL